MAPFCTWLSLLLLLACCGTCDAMRVASRSPLLRLRGGLDAKWTPNGEGPAPYSTKARQQAGMDPAATAGGAAPAAGGGGMKLTFIMLLVMYLANNWNIAVAIQAFVMKLLAPLLNSYSARKEASEQQAAAATKKALLAARKARLNAKAKKAEEDEE